MTYIVKREKFKTEMGKKLFDRLVEISDDDNFILAVLVETQGDDKKKEFIDWLDKTGVNNPDIILDYLDEKYD